MIKYFLILLCTVLLNGCSNLPIDTLNKRIAAFEITYNETLKTVLLYLKEDRFSEHDKQLVQEAVRDTSTARAAMYIAKGIGDLETAQGQLLAAQSALQFMRDYLTRAEGKTTSTIYWSAHA